MLRLLFLTLIPLSAFASEKGPSLIGVWRSNADASNAHLEKYAKLTDYQKKVFANLFGRAVITYRSDGTGTLLMEAGVFPKEDGSEIEVRASTTKFTFKVLATAESQVVIETSLENEPFEGFPFAILKFQDQDTYSVSLSDGISDLNGREVFRRVKSE